MELVTESTEQSQQCAAQIAQKILSLPLGPTAIVIGLEGELGAGKTTFVQGFIRSLGITEPVRSPTFLLMKSYTLGERTIYHLDCYRINNSKELGSLEIDLILQDPSAIILIEWPERVQDILPAERITIHLDHLTEHQRKITVSGISL